MPKTCSRRSPTNPSPSNVDFSKLAPLYDELRQGNHAELVELLVREGDLRGTRVLDVGCGTGSLAVVLAEQYACKVWGVDASPEMLDVARAKVPAGVGLKLGRAEELPFKDGWFERAVATLAVHLWDRPRAFAELHRVLAPGGRFALASFNPAHFESYYLNTYFPSILAIDTARFAPADVLAAELREAGFADVQTADLTHDFSISREDALARIRGRHISTFQLIGEEEYEAGLARAERELPERVDFTQHWVMVSAAR
jgi:ubiquinone/menaquinone biosynthesis C-methylase UbiE